LQALRTSWLAWKTKQIHGAKLSTVLQIMAKNESFRLNKKLTYAKYGIYVSICMVCNQNYVDQTVNNISN